MAVVLFASTAFVACGGDDDNGGNEGGKDPDPVVSWHIDGTGSAALVSEIEGWHKLYVAPTAGAASLADITADKFYYCIDYATALADGKSHNLATLTEDELYSISVMAGNSGVNTQGLKPTGTITLSCNEEAKTVSVALDMTLEGVKYKVNYSGSVLVNDNTGSGGSGGDSEIFGEGEVVAGDSELDLLYCYYDAGNADYVSYYMTEKPATALADISGNDVVVVKIAKSGIKEDKELEFADVAVRFRGVDYTGTCLYYIASKDGYTAFRYEAAGAQFTFGYEGYTEDVTTLKK